jgi:hypothetical protein
MRFIFLILLLPGLFIKQIQSGIAQTQLNPTPEQLIQLMRSQPPVDFSAPVTAVASFDPPLVHPGEKSVYRITLNTTAVSVNLPQKLNAPAGLKIHFNASGQTMQIVDGGFQNFSTYDYDVRPDAPGGFTMPEFTVEVDGKPVMIPATRLEVKNNLPATHEPVRQLLVRSSTTNVFVGETFTVSALLPASLAGIIESVSDVQFTGGSFVVDKNALRQSIRAVEVNGRQVQAFIYETSITPIAGGILNLSAQGFTTGLRLGSPNVINGQITVAGGPARYILLDSEPLAINIRPLPTESQLPGFLGAVGDYVCDQPTLATNTLKIGEPGQLSIIIRGQKNLSRINPPLPPSIQGWQIFPAERGGILPGMANQPPGASFKYILIPLTDAVRATPAIPFSCFDPARGDYVDLSIPSLPVTVLAGETPTNAEASLMFSENAPYPESKSSLSKLASSPGRAAGSLVPWQTRGWFPFVQILPVLGFFGLWCWDRRRRHLEQHPEIVRRREARRALRHERRFLEQAAAGGNVEKFVRHAITALQVASAPHYPASPRAVVSGDVLQILTGPERDGKAGEIVRRFFAVADAAAFANRSENQTELLAEKSALKEVLLKLEARL